MKIHSSAYNIKIPFGKYKGFSLGYIYDINRSYLEWMSGADGMVPIWREAAARVCLGQDVSSLFSTDSEVKIPKGNVVAISKDKLRVTFEYDKEFVERFKYEIDGRVWDPDTVSWIIPSVQIRKLVALFGGTKNLKADNLTKKIWRNEEQRKEDLDEIRVREESDIDIPTKLPLYPYQKVAVEFIKRAGGRAMVADQMGLGKTPTAIGYAELHKLKTLIVCPKSVVTHWTREIKKFAGKNSAVWYTDGRFGRSDCRYHVINYDIVSRYIKDLNKMDFDLLICDEATYLKNRRTKRAKSVLGYWKERRIYPGIKTKHCVFLTGTPVLNNPTEAFSLLSFLDKNRFNNYKHFVTRYGGAMGIMPQNLEDLHERTKDLIIRRTKSVVASELPDKQRNDLYVEMSQSDIKEYNQHLTTLFRKWKTHGKPSAAEMPAIQQFLITKKIPRATELIDELLESDRGILIFSVYIDPLKKLLRHYDDKAAMVYGSMNQKQRQESIDRLSSGKAKVGLFSVGAGSMGIDGIQYQIDTVLFLDQWWVPAVHEQAEDRVHRIGQNNKVQIFYLLCENTIDEYMRTILTEKQRVVDTVVDGRLVSIARDRSFFKEFVSLLQQNYGKTLQKYDEIEEVDESFGID